jgi:hypothetical protein
MNNSRILTPLFCFGAIIIWVISSYTAYSLVSYHSNKTMPIKNVRDIFLSKALASTDSALKIMPELRLYQFPSAMENPFKPASEADPPVLKHRQGLAPETQVKLSLKGVLLKAQPLAILEDATGKTYICGVGETVCGQTVEDIGATRVTLHNTLGSYSLVVKE